MLPTYAPSPHSHSRLQPVPTFFSAEMLSPRARVSARGGPREVELFTNSVTAGGDGAIMGEEDAEITKTTWNEFLRFFLCR